MSLRLAIVVSHPIQYYSPWFRYLANDGLLEIKVFFLSDFGTSAYHDEGFGTRLTWDVDLLDGYVSEFVPNAAKRPSVTRFNGLVNKDLRARILTMKPDAILVFGYAYRTNIDLILRPCAPVIFRGDSHLIGGKPPSLLKRLLLRIIYARCSAFLPVGRANEAYFRCFGVPRGKLFHAPHSVDHERFNLSHVHRKLGMSIRADLGIPDKACVVLFSGKLQPKKRPDLLLSAFLEAEMPNSHLVIAGDGEMTTSLQTRARVFKHVHFLPFANQSDMPARYAMADLFVLPSQGGYETWGLAVNEAMHMGLPCVVSDHVGCQVDLVPSDSTGESPFGWSFPAGDQNALTQRLRVALSCGRPGLAAIGLRAREHVSASVTPLPPAAFTTRSAMWWPSASDALKSRHAHNYHPRFFSSRAAGGGWRDGKDVVGPCSVIRRLRTRCVFDIQTVARVAG